MQTKDNSKLVNKTTKASPDFKKINLGLLNIENVKENLRSNKLTIISPNKKLSKNRKDGL